MTADGRLKCVVGEAQRTERFADYIDAVLGDAGLEYPAGFLEYVTKRRMSKEGRFYRIHYRTGATLDVVPPGSLATGWELVRDDRRKAGWRFVRPDMDRLWRDYAAKHRHSELSSGTEVHGCTPQRRREQLPAPVLVLSFTNDETGAARQGPFGCVNGPIPGQNGEVRQLPSAFARSAESLEGSQ